jgi:hypothetical protein
LPEHDFAIERENIPLSFVHEHHLYSFLLTSNEDSSDSEANSDNVCTDSEQPPAWTGIYGNPHLDNRLASKHITDKYIDSFENEIEL